MRVCGGCGREMWSVCVVCVWGVGRVGGTCGVCESVCVGCGENGRDCGVCESVCESVCVVCVRVV